LHKVTLQPQRLQAAAKKNLRGIPVSQKYRTIFVRPFVQEGQHPLTGQRAANFRLLTNQ